MYIVVGAYGMFPCIHGNFFARNRGKTGYVFFDEKVPVCVGGNKPDGIDVEIIFVFYDERSNIISFNSWVSNKWDITKLRKCSLIIAEKFLSSFFLCFSFFLEPL
jgi:hypothetical protein